MLQPLVVIEKEGDRAKTSETFPMRESGAGRPNLDQRRSTSASSRSHGGGGLEWKRHGMDEVLGGVCEEKDSGLSGRPRCRSAWMCYHVTEEKEVQTIASD